MLCVEDGDGDAAPFPRSARFGGDHGVDVAELVLVVAFGGGEKKEEGEGDRGERVAAANGEGERG